MMRFFTGTPNYFDAYTQQASTHPTVQFAALTGASSTIPSSYLVFPLITLSITCLEIILSHKSLRRTHNATLGAFVMAILLNLISTNTHLSKDNRCPSRRKAPHQQRRLHYVATMSFMHSATQCMCPHRALRQHDQQPRHAMNCSGHAPLAAQLHHGKNKRN